MSEAQDPHFVQRPPVLIPTRYLHLVLPVLIRPLGQCIGDGKLPRNCLTESALGYWVGKRSSALEHTNPTPGHGRRREPHDPA